MTATPVPSANSSATASGSGAAFDPQVLLEETRRLRGVSLWQDAYRRLQRNLLARWSLRFLVVIAVLTLLTPVIPFQSPILQNLKTRQFAAPNLQPVSLGVVAWQRKLAECEQQIAALPASGEDNSESTRRSQLQQEKQQLVDSDPFRTLWNRPGWVTRKMIDLRVVLFGDWCIPSICGCDSLGRDVLSRISWGARVSLVVGIVASMVSLVIGVSYGAVSGYLGGWVDDVMMRIVDILYSIPFIFVVIFLMTILSEPSIKKRLAGYHIDQMVIFYLVIGAIYWLTMARVVRGQVLSLKNEQFIEAARTIGAGRLRIVFRHIVPNVFSVVIVYLTLTIPAVMLFEAFLSFLGLGVSPPDVSLGLLINEGLQGITPIKVYGWLIAFPGLALTLTLFALNFLGDGLRDALDPRMKNR